MWQEVDASAKQGWQLEGDMKGISPWDFFFYGISTVSKVK
jgi:hypothetical protein